MITVLSAGSAGLYAAGSIGFYAAVITALAGILLIRRRQAWA